MLSLLARRVARRIGGDAVASIVSPCLAVEIGNASSASSLRSWLSSAPTASTSGASPNSFIAAASGAQSGNSLRRYSAAAFLADLTPPSPPSPPSPPNPVGAASHLKASLKPRQGRNRFARAWKRMSETQADARRRKHETSVALAVRDAKRRRRWAAAGSAARGADGEIL